MILKVPSNLDDSMILRIVPITHCLKILQCSNCFLRQGQNNKKNNKKNLIISDRDLQNMENVLLVLAKSKRSSN